MVKIRTLVPVTHPTTDEEFDADTEVDVADDVAATWKAQGKITFIADEEASAAAVGVYNEVTGREDTKPLDPEEPAPEAHSSKKGKK